MGRSRTASLVAACLVVAALAGAGCSRSSGGKDEFCAALPKTGDVMSLLGEFGTADPTALEARFEKGIASYRDLERAAPRSIRGDVAQVADTVEMLLGVVQDNQGDLPAIRAALQAKATQLASAGRAAAKVSDYAKTECGVDLESLVPGGASTTTPPATAPPTTR